MEPIYKKSTVDLAVEKLTDYIRSDAIEIGQKLPAEAVFCKELNISRTTVREAYRYLQSQGYLEIRAGKGAFVRSKERDFMQEATEWISSHKVQCSDYLFARLALDPMVARIAAENATETDIDDLRQIHEEFVDTVKCRDNEKLQQLDARFHERIAKITNNDLFLSLVRITNYYFQILRENSFCFENHVTRAIEPHERILKAIAEKNPEQAAKESIEHMMLAFDDLCGWRPQI